MILNKLFNVSALTIYQETKGEEGYESEAIKIETMRDMHSLGETGKEKICESIGLNPNTSVVFEGLPIERTAWVDSSMCLYFPCPINIAIVDSNESVEWPYGPELGPPADPVSIIRIVELKNVEPPLHTNS